MERIIGIIPARLQSSRLPNKPLLEINGKPILQHCIERTGKSAFLQSLMISFPSTDSDICAFLLEDSSTPSIPNNLLGISISGIDELCLNGTERCYYTLKEYGPDDLDTVNPIVVNIQADNIFFDPKIIDEGIFYLLTSNLEVCTVVHRHKLSQHEKQDSSKVKAEINKLWGKTHDTNFLKHSSIVAKDFVRTLDGVKERMHGEYLEHYGIYFYRWSALKKYMELEPSKNELDRSLEQMRFVDNGIQVGLCVTDRMCEAVNTKEDLKRLRAACGE